MKNDAVLQVRIDSQLKKEAENLFDSIGISFAEAVRIFAVQCIEYQGLPFELKKEINSKKVLHASGIASKYADISKIELEKLAWQQAAKERI